MTNDDQVDHLLEEVPSNSTRLQGRPFHIVLVDIKIAAKNHHIQCVEKPLEGEEDLKFVALSYRWGEVQETTVDTGLEYPANITSFDLDDFYQLCKNMTLEPDLKDMAYVWVDAICVDQTNLAKRKTTIYRMTNIYERANYIVAVPDLHLAHLKNSSQKNADIIVKSRNYSEYLYHLIHGNAKKLDQLDDEFLDSGNVPQNPKLRYLLKKYSFHSAPAFMTCLHDIQCHGAKGIHDRICETDPASRTLSNHLHVSHLYNALVTSADYNRTTDLDKMDIQGLHICDNEGCCPLDVFDKGEFSIRYERHLEQYTNHHRWKQDIVERSEGIRQSIEFLEDIIKDWSTRVWVISEFHIAKNKNNNKMKYWFLQLRIPWTSEKVERSFFEFDFSGAPYVSASSTRHDGEESLQIETCHPLCRFTGKMSNFLYLVLHDTVRRQLVQQTFLEMMLKSKASRHEDRFHAILPSSEYKHNLVNKDQVDGWLIDTLVSVKLQLYEWMSTKDKLMLLFLSSNGSNVGRSLPTFATSNIKWDIYGDYLREDKFMDTTKWNFDLDDESTLMLTRQTNNLYKLTIKPKNYYFYTGYPYQPDPATILRLVQLGLSEEDKLDIICISHMKIKISVESFFGPIYNNFSMFLVGCWKKNKFIVSTDSYSTYVFGIDDEEWLNYEYVDNDADAEFNIY